MSTSSGVGCPGRLNTQGGRVRITAQLIDATNGAHLWADSFDGSLTGPRRPLGRDRGILPDRTRWCGYPLSLPLSNSLISQCAALSATPCQCALVGYSSEARLPHPLRGVACSRSPGRRRHSVVERVAQAARGEGSGREIFETMRSPNGVLRHPSCRRRSQVPPRSCSWTSRGWRDGAHD